MDRKPEAYDSTYVFSAEQQEEVRKIYQKYMLYGSPKKTFIEDKKIDRLRRLDKSVSQCSILSLLLTGIAGAIIHIAGIAWIQQRGRLVLGAGIALSGLVLFLAAHPLSVHVTKRWRQKVEPEILRLCEELMK